MTILLRLHAFIGLVALIAFWIAIFSRKGGRIHIASGKMFTNCAYVIVATALIRSACIIFAASVFVNVPANLSTQDAARVYSGARTFHIFLAYLAIVTLTTVRHGVRVVQTRESPGSLRTPFHVTLNVAALLSGVGMICLSYCSGSVLFAALSPIGILIGFGNLMYIRNPAPTRMSWWYAHMGSMIGCGIAMHTAFLVFGLRRIIEINLIGPWNVLPWLLPTIVGVPGIVIWTRHYREKFGEIRSSQS